MYATRPNRPKNTPLTVFPTRPPMPKLLSNSRMEPASVIHNMISVYRPIPSSCFFLFLLPERVPVFFLVLFFFVAAIFLTPLKVPAVCTYRTKLHVTAAIPIIKQ